MLKASQDAAIQGQEQLHIKRRAAAIRKCLELLEVRLRYNNARLEYLRSVSVEEYKQHYKLLHGFDLSAMAVSKEVAKEIIAIEGDLEQLNI